MRVSIQSASMAIVCALGLTALLSAELFAQDNVRSDHRLPPGVLLYGATPDIPATYEAFKNTSYGQLINSPELEEFRVQLLEKFQEEASEGLEKIESELGMPLSDLAALLAGDATISIVRPIGQPLGAVVFLEYGDHQDIVDRLIELSDQAISDETGFEKQTEEYAGAKLNYYTIQTEHPDYSEIDITYFMKDGQFVLTSSRSLAESVLDLWDGKSEQTFANDEFYSAILKQCATTDGSTPDTIWYVNPIGVTTAALELVPQAKPFVNLIPLYLPTLGLNRLKASGSTMELDAGEFNIVSKSMVYVDRPASGILRMFELRETIEGVPAWVPADVTQFFATDWNVSGAYEAIEAVVDGFMGPGAFDRQVTDLTRQANQNNLHLKRDIADVLSGKIQGYYKQKFEGADVDVQFAVSIGVTDEDKAWKLIEAAVESAGEVQEHDIRGNRAYSVITPDDAEIAITIKDGQIFVASKMDRLWEVVEGKAGGDALKDSAEFKRGQKHLPAKVSMLSYQSPKSTLRDPYEKLRLGEYDAATEGEFDFSVLPPFEKIEKYLTPTFSYLQPIEKGAYSVQFGLKPAK